MGLLRKSSCHYRDRPTVTYLTDTPDINPNPSNFQVVRLVVVGKFLVCDLCYPNCTNFEGRKILVYRDLTKAKFKKLQKADPHFYPSSLLVARFVPTIDGWEMAVSFCKHANASFL